MSASSGVSSLSCFLDSIPFGVGGRGSGVGGGGGGAGWGSRGGIDEAGHACHGPPQTGWLCAARRDVKSRPRLIR